MRALVVYCHPRPESFTAAVRDVVLGRLQAAGVEVRLCDLYGRGFDPVLSAGELERYEDTGANTAGIEADVAYPTWWYRLPALLKGWLDRVLVPGLAFEMPDQNGDIKPGLTHITRLGVFTTCGASRWLTFFVGAPGRRTILRGVRLLCAKGCRTAYAAHYLMDSSTDVSRRAHLEAVARKVDRLVGQQRAQKEATA